MAKTALIIGSGPAGLMAADVLSAAGVAVTVLERRTSPGRKLLVAGSSGLNITNGAAPEAFAAAYSGGAPSYWLELLGNYSPQQWLQFVEALGFETFLGTSDRYFVREMKASKLLKAWIDRLTGQGVGFKLGAEFKRFKLTGSQVNVQLSSGEELTCDALALAVGGGSWEDRPVLWPGELRSLGLRVSDFKPSNVGYKVDWSEAFLKEADRKPLKNIALTSSRGTRRGDALITNYGIEGTPVYFVGTSGEVTIDLLPDLTCDQILDRLSAVRENLSPLRRVKKQLKLSEAAQALVFHYASQDMRQSVEAMAFGLKNFKLTLKESQPLSEAISSAGGLSMDELDRDHMIKTCPGVFAAGEMLDWDAPTGGFLIQACVGQGYRMGHAMLKRLR